MPTYDYRCDACGHEMELFQKMSDKPKRKCPACGKMALVRLIGTGAGVIFKGGGFYETDYRSDSYKKAAEADKKSADSATSSDSSGSDSSGSSKDGKSESKDAGSKEKKASTKADKPTSKAEAKSSGSKGKAKK